MRQYFIPRSPKDKGFTLVEVLLTTAILAMILASMVPFVRTVYNSWNLGDRKTEIQQNGRVGLATMSRYLMQAKRITGIPASGSGNFVKFRDYSDTQTIIFYHNVSGSPYYIGNTGLIKNNDLVIRTIDINGNTANALLANSLYSFNINFKDSLGQIVTKPYNVYFLEISMSLSDSQGLILDILNVFSTISVRPAVRINKLVWLAYGVNVVELSSDTSITGFSNANSISIIPSDGSCWVADTSNNHVKKISSNGAVLVDLSGISSPNAVSVNSTLLVNGKETIWVAETGGNCIRRISWNGSAWNSEIITGGTGNARFSSPSSVSVNPSEIINGKETCWVADTGRDRIRRLYWTGSAWTYDNIANFSGPRSVSANPNEIVNGKKTCWVADTVGNRVRKIYWSGSAYTYTNLSMGTGSSPRFVSVNNTDGTCWVANAGTNASNGNRIRKLSGSGTNPITILLNATGFSTPYAVSANPTEGSCWVADTGNNQVVKLDSEGNEEFRISGFPSPLSVASAP
jgi:prepilin-type N-terminal cleavage/methylation domain-containing protein